MQSRPKASQSPTVLDLFAGAGGLSLGFQNAGFRVLAGVDNDPSAMVTFANNFPDSRALVADLSLTDSILTEHLKGESADVIVGGPPCQGFSLAGFRNEFDPRNELLKNYLSVVEFFRPKAVVIENVPSMLSLYGGRAGDAIRDGLSALDYQLHEAILNSADYGVPQNRRRVFFVATRSDLEWDYSFPEPTTREAPLTTWDAISDLPPLRSGLGAPEQPYRSKPKTPYQDSMRSGSTTLFNHEAVNHHEKTRSTIALVPDGGSYKDLPECLQNTRRVNIAWTRMNSKKPCFTIDAGHNHHFHYKENRVPTVRESARIQSFPDSFIFNGNRGSQYRQVGNAVPPLVAEAIARELKKGLRVGDI